MEKIRKNNIRSFKYVHFLLYLGLFAVFWKWHKEYAQIAFSPRYDLFIYMLYAFMTYFFMKTYNCYQIGFSSLADLIFSQSVSSLMGNFLLYASTALVWQRLYPPLMLLLLCLAQMLLNLLWSLAAEKLYFHKNPPLKTYIIYKEPEDLNRTAEIKTHKKLFSIEKKIQIKGDDIKEILRELENCQAVIVVGVSATLRNGIAKYCVEKDITGYFMPHIGDIILAGSEHIQAFSIPVLSVIRANPDPAYLLFKRVSDILISFIGIIISFPIMLLTALALLISEGFPVFYRQIRLTTDGKKFKILKFRTMCKDAEKDGKARLASQNDSRITPIGAILRRFRLDELPQLFNILKGDMSLVGPRPERPEIAAEYEKEMPAFKLRLQVKAGLTGYAQIYGKYNSNPYDKLQMDLMYINKMNPVTDLQLIFATIKILFIKESTEGIADGKTNAK